MIQSMTGFGKAIQQFSDKKLTIEIRSLNSKQIDLNVRMPLAYKEKEIELRKFLAEHLKRGKIELGFYVESTSGASTNSINFDVVKAYMNDFSKVAPESTEGERLTLALRMQDAIQQKREEVDQKEWILFKEVVQEAIARLIQFRVQEGLVMAQDFTLRIQNIQQLLAEVEPFEKERIETIKERINKSLEQLEISDKNRFEQELIFYLEKLDVTEEKVRLANHCNYFLKEMNKERNGKKLGFICQEIGREINTLGSKSNHSELQKIVVKMKDELEKIKEQLLNVL